MPRFSVVVPAHNRRLLLEQTLSSVWAQTCRDFEVIVVDDGSTDNTDAYLATLGDRVRTLRLDGRGPGAARNAGAVIATGQYLAFLDSDDLWLPWTLATFDAVVTTHQPALLCASFRDYEHPAELADERAGPLVVHAFADYYSTWPRQLAVGAGMIAVRKSEFDRVGGFAADRVNLEDHDLTLRLGTAPGFVQIVQPLTLGWRRHGASVTGDLTKSVEGCALLVARERSGRYPGGAALAPIRRAIITTHARALSMECVKAGRARDFARIYRSILDWHLALGRWKYLCAFPWLMGAAWMRPRAN
jgi:GT2 family glycosyltransferase